MNDVYKPYFEMRRAKALFTNAYEFIYGSNNYAFDSDLLSDIQSINKVTKILLENAGDSNATRNS